MYVQNKLEKLKAKKNKGRINLPDNCSSPTTKSYMEKWGGSPSKLQKGKDQKIYRPLCAGGKLIICCHQNLDR